ncbi:MAG: NrfD/PsrC family molybdoenzyme membrane anchor subunit [Solirubrobacteraceae bacterium]
MSARDSYYGRPILKQPTWTWEIPFYFFFGGMAGASATFATVAELAGEDDLARRAWAVALGGMAVGPPLLISDLGRPARFLNMLRVFKPTSPMSVGSWILNGAGATITLGVARTWFGRIPRLGRASHAAGFAGPALATYTAVLVADTAIPVWHDARLELPFVFASGSAMSAGSAIALAGGGAPARRLALAGAVGELASTAIMEHRLGPLIGEPYREGRAGKFAKLSKGLTAAGAVTMAAARGERRASAAGAALMLGGALATRWSVFHAGRQGAADPKYVVEPQRARRAARA